MNTFSTARAVIPKYKELLLTYGVSSDDAKSIIDRAELDFSDVLQIKAATESQMAELRRHANRVIHEFFEGERNELPETQTLT